MFSSVYCSYVTARDKYRSIVDTGTDRVYSLCVRDRNKSDTKRVREQRVEIRKEIKAENK